MKNYVRLLGRIIQDQTLKSPETARKIIDAAYTWVKLSATHSPFPTVHGASEYMRGVTAGVISNSFRNPKNAVMVNIFMPCEIFHAMDIIPMYPEAISEYIACTGCQEVFAQRAEENDIPETFCSYHKTMIGLAETGVMPAPLMIANTTLACDANQLSFRRLADYYNVPHSVIDIPHANDQSAVEYVAEQLEDLVPVLEDLTGKSLSRERLKATMERSKRTIEKFRHFINQRGRISLPTTMTSEMCSMMVGHLLLGTAESEKYTDKLLRAAQHAPRDNGKKKRIFWVHTLPLWQESLENIFNESESCEIVGTDTSVDYMGTVDPEKPFLSMASRIVKNSYNGPATNRIENILTNARLSNADGIIIFCHWGCKQTLGMSQMAKQRFESEGFPTLVLDGDGCDARNVADGQMVTRVNAFLEQLEALK